jgi:hypothetical protein
LVGIEGSIKIINGLLTPQYLKQGTCLMVLERTFSGKRSVTVRQNEAYTFENSA